MQELTQFIDKVFSQVPHMKEETVIELFSRKPSVPGCRKLSGEYKRKDGLLLYALINKGLVTALEMRKMRV